MATQPNNPFVLPGFGQPGEMGQNPLLASMEMMRQTWQNLAGLGGFDTSMMSAALSPEDLERRISDLRAVENWLRMNLSMLSSTIQGMEVQRATVSTLRTFVQSAQAAGSSTPEGVSPLEAVLGIRRGTTSSAASANAGASAAAGAEPASAPTPGAAPEADQSGGTRQAKSDDAAPDTDDPMAGANAAAQGWWNMLQQQFDNLAAATSATLQGAEALKAGMGGTAAPAAAKPKASRKTAARKSAAGKTAARKTAGKSAAGATRSAAKKTAARSRKAPKA
jgi:hypothetical protein